jgi:hypothetical protein
MRAPFAGRRLSTTAIATGTVLLGVSLAGTASVDRTLTAATTAATATSAATPLSTRATIDFASNDHGHGHGHGDGDGGPPAHGDGGHRHGPEL